MKQLTSTKVEKYFKSRTDEELRHCPDCLAAACNDGAVEFDHDALDLLKLLCFNDPVKGMFTHSYGFHTKTGRNIIEILKEYFLCDTLLRKQGLLYFCRLIEEIEYKLNTNKEG